jgi:hypothetical protein
MWREIFQDVSAGNFQSFCLETKLQDEFLKQFEDYVNLNVLGKPWAKGNWGLSTTHNLNKEKRQLLIKGCPHSCLSIWMPSTNLLTSFYGDEKRKVQ